MSETKDNYEVLENGDICATTSYPEKDVEIKTTKGSFIVGKQPGYIVKNIIRKDKIPILKEYVVEQRDALQPKYEAGQDIIKKFENINEADKIIAAIEKIPKDMKDKRTYVKHLEHVNKLAQDITMKINAEANCKLMKTAIDKLNIQIDFIEKVEKA